MGDTEIMTAGETSTTGSGGFAPGHALLLEALLPVCARHHLLLAGAPALRAHGLPLPTRRTEELELVTGDSTPVATVADDLAEAARTAGCEVTAQVPGTPLLAGLQTTPPYEPLGRPVTVAVGKRPLGHPPTRTDALLGRPVPLVAREDAAGLAVVAAADRTLADDLLTLHALTAWFSEGELLALAAAVDEEFLPGALAERLDKLAALDDESYQRRGAAPERVPDIKRWALGWAQDITLDLLEGREHPDSYYEVADGTDADGTDADGMDVDGMDEHADEL